MILTDQCRAQPSSEKVPPAGDGNKDRDPRQRQMHWVRDVGTLSPKWNAAIRFLPTGQKEPCGRGGRRTLRARWGGRYEENKASTRMASQRLWYRHRACQMGFQHWKKQVISPFPNPDAISHWQQLLHEKLVLFRESRWDRTLLRVWPTHSKLSGGCALCLRRFSQWTCVILILQVLSVYVVDLVLCFCGIPVRANFPLWLLFFCVYVQSNFNLLVFVLSYRILLL